MARLILPTKLETGKVRTLSPFPPPGGSAAGGRERTKEIDTPAGNLPS